MHNSSKKIVLIGAGIMSATLALLLKKLNPNFKIALYERLPGLAKESSAALNNAGTGHSAFCELNYTPQLPDGSIDITKAIRIARAFELSKEFWASLIENEFIHNPSSFIHQVPHQTFVWGQENCAYLFQRYQALKKHPLFNDMLFSDEASKIAQWMPLVMEQRIIQEKYAATHVPIGTDVNFEQLSCSILSYLQTQGVDIYTAHEVKQIDRDDNKKWYLEIEDTTNSEHKSIVADFIFIGAGGGSLPLLDDSGITEAKGYGGFPISGQWLICNNETVISKHSTKVYGKASVGSPPMSVPHLDTRYIDGKKQLLFGPFAGFSTKFLKEGSYWDLPESIEADNLYPMLMAGLHNVPLTKYLIQQLRLSPEDKLNALKEYMPTAQLQDWDLAIAGQRVQIIKKDNTQGGVLEFGTEIICSSDHSLAALLGASPGASTAVDAMMRVITLCFSEELESEPWQQNLKTLIPSFYKDFNQKEVVINSRNRTHSLLF